MTIFAVNKCEKYGEKKHLWKKTGVHFFAILNQTSHLLPKK